ncbi:MAG TPA: pirin family protein [Actinomycetota bacterium]|nr:MAG: pirin family protein [Actinomycetota bacterium]HNL51824.1 pirin family protein [Actinomycetota bacterium]
MSNLERRPAEESCEGHRGEVSPPVQQLEPREVPLGGPRAMTVRRTLPHKQIRTVGAWCFVDHYGPDDIEMSVPPHPHIGLQTVSWLLSGEVEHRDSLGSLQRVRPGELNLMTAGHGIAHSEYSVGSGPLHGVQLWVALTEAHRGRAPAFSHHADLPVLDDAGLRATVMVGEFAEAVSSAQVLSPLVGAQLEVEGEVTVPLEPDFEYAVLAMDADVTVGGEHVPRGALQYLGWGARDVRLAAPGVRALLLGGEPLSEDLLMWWNFVGRSHEEIVQAREDWEAGTQRFGEVAGDPTERLPAPALPTVALKPRPSRR